MNGNEWAGLIIIAVVTIIVLSAAVLLGAATGWIVKELVS